MAKDIIFGTVGGLGLFLYGMRLMSEGLKSISGERLKRILSMLTKNRLVAVMVGAGFTALIQSSSAMTVMAVGLVNSGLLTLTQAIGVVMGANIGTTFTAWLVSAMAVFKISQYAYPAIGIGFALIFFGKRRSTRNWGRSLLGFGLIFLGLSVLKDAFGPLRDSQMIKDMFMNFGQNPLLGVLVGAATTIVMQSSSVTIAIIQVMALQGLLDFNAAVPLILGDNIGTTVTAQLASLKSSVNARRTANAHTGFNLIGVMYMLPLVWLGWYPRFIDWIVPGQITPISIMANIAMAHTVFNVVNTMVFLPLTRLLERGVILITPAGKGIEIEGRPRHLDKRLLQTPRVALDQARLEVLRMTEMAREAVRVPMEGLFARDNKRLDEVPKLEDAIDELQGEITRYMVDLSKENLAQEVADEIPVWLHSINDVEKVGDHAENLGDLTDRVLDERIVFSDEGGNQLRAMYDSISSMISLIIEAMDSMNRRKAEEVLEVEKEVNDLHLIAREGNLHRMNAGVTNPETGLIFLDYIMNLEKIGDHLSNVAIAIKREFHYVEKKVRVDT
jgi:phosphate:Na+ symporter